MTERRSDYGFLVWLNFFLGVWLILAPFVLGYTDILAAKSIDILIGVLVVSLSFYVAIRHTSTTTVPLHRGGGDAAISWLQVPLGILLILAPFVLGYAELIGGNFINHVIVGALIALIGALVAYNHTTTEIAERPT